MNYWDANQLQRTNIYKLAEDMESLRTPSKKGVSVLAKTIEAYFKNGNYGRFFA